MHPLEWLAIQVVVGMVGVAWIYSLIVRPGGPLTAKRSKQLAELEVRVRMDSGEELIEDLIEIAKVYGRMGKRWEADQSLRRAMSLAKQQWGDSSPPVINILEESARLMDSMKRSSEAKNYRNQIKEIKKRNAG
jgi:hypothetical protein